MYTEVVNSDVKSNEFVNICSEVLIMVTDFVNVAIEMSCSCNVTM